MKKQELYQIFQNIENEHVNLYHDITKEEFLKHLNKSAEKIEKLNNAETCCEIYKLIRLFKDAHTWVYFINEKFLPIKFIKIDNKIYLSSVPLKQKELFLQQVQKINGHDINFLFKKASNLLPIETKEDNKVKTLDYLTEINFLNLLGIGDCSNGINLTLQNGEYFVPYSSHFPSQKSISLYPKTPYKIYRKNDVHVLEYAGCQDYKNYPIDDFCKDIENQLKENENITVDLRGNQGGNSLYFDKITEILKKKNCHGYCIIDNGVFSGGNFALSNCLWLGFKTIGSKPGQKFVYYGNCGTKFDLPELNLRYRASTSYFGENKKRVLLDEKPIPDIKVENSIEDWRNNYDKVLLTAINLIKGKVFTKDKIKNSDKEK